MSGRSNPSELRLSEKQLNEGYCCLLGCCGAGSWCCEHSHPHEHDPEDWLDEPISTPTMIDRMGVWSNPMEDSAYDMEPLQEELITFPERLIAVIQACEIMGFGWSCEKELIELRGEGGEVEEEAVHFRFKTFKKPKVVPPETVAEFEDD